MKTQINWMLHNYCTSECSYCPIKFKGGEPPRGILEYVEVTQQLINHYKSLGRTIDWIFNGGEPLDMFDFPMILKLCKEHGGTIDLTTNGGKLWLDWWAIEPHIDTLHLSYHYWQNPNLIKFIIQAFKKVNKHIDITVPIRPNYFDEDLKRALDIEAEFNLVVSKSVLYNEADPVGGMFPYTEQQLRIIRGEDIVQAQQYYKETTFQERYEDKIKENPIYTGFLCNVGIEKLVISHLGWVAGSACNDKPLGNIWNNNPEPVSDAEVQQKLLNKITLPTTPHTCGMRACMDKSDQLITKFPQKAHIY